jgi:hypothetical protein
VIKEGIFKYCLTPTIRGRTLFDSKNGNVAKTLINNSIIGWGAFRLIAELDFVPSGTGDIR